MEVGAADSAGEDAEEDVIGDECGVGDVFDSEGLVGGVEDGGFHGCSPVDWAERLNTDWHR